MIKGRCVVVRLLFIVAESRLAFANGVPSIVAGWAAVEADAGFHRLQRESRPGLELAHVIM